MKNWREDAQPEWPEAASATRATPTAEGDTQAFAETAAQRVAPADADETTVLPQAAAADGSGSEGRADLTELLSAFDRFDRSEAAGGAGGAHETPRRARSGGEVFTPRAGARTPAAGAAPRDPFPPVGAGVSGSHETPVASARASAPASAAAPVSTAGTPASGAVGDPWDEPAPSGHTHDPHEVTIQLDGIGLQLDGSLRAAKAAPRGGGAEGSDGPVFVDESGRRSRRFRRLGMLVGIACAVYAVVIVATVLSGNSNAPWLPVQAPQQDTPAGQVDTSPQPAESAPPAGTDGVTPGASPSVSDGVTPSPGADATAPDETGTTEEPGSTTDPEPTATKPTTRPGADPTPDPDPTDTAPTPDPEPTETDTGEPTPDPTPTEEPGDTAGTGTDTVAAAPVDPGPVTEGPTAPASPYDPSPEYTL
ncbi:hypothetical protein [Streptomyces sp. NPDC126514]|uniref:hypothetical protein n=1 Tax=Streptomyces sp. NPDC126514 TaxID=3155210 RepID=UPI0033343397